MAHEVELLQALCDYLSRVLDGSHYDVVVCMERRGLALFREAHNRCGSGNARSLGFLSSVSVAYNEFTDKAVLIFDDAMAKGGHIDSIVRALRTKGASSINVAVMAKARNCAYPTLKPMWSVGKSAYETRTEQISEFLASALRPVDADHILVLGKMRPSPNPEKLRNLLSILGDVYTSDDEPSPKLTKLAVREPKFFDPTGLAWLQRLIPIPQLKFRLNVSQNGELCGIPVCYPEILEIPGQGPPDHAVEYCLCTRHRDSAWVTQPVSAMAISGKEKEHLINWFLYSHCVQFNLSCFLLVKFLERMKLELQRAAIEIKNLSVEYERAREVLHDSEMLDYLNGLVAKIAGK